MIITTRNLKTATLEGDPETIRAVVEVLRWAGVVSGDSLLLLHLPRIAALCSKVVDAPERAR